MPRTVWLIGLISFVNDSASEMLYPLMPLYWAAPGLEDTLLRCHIQPEYLNGHYQKEVQQGI